MNTILTFTLVLCVYPVLHQSWIKLKRMDVRELLCQLVSTSQTFLDVKIEETKGCFS